MWIDPARAGEGWTLEVLSDSYVLLYWFTYDEQGDQRWLQGIGSIDNNEHGDVLNFSDLYITSGGRFGPDFDPDEVELEFVGDAVMTFSDCNHGSFSYSAFGQSQTFAIERLTQTMAAGCSPIHGVPGEPVREYSGQSGSWLDLAHTGEGFSMHWLSRDDALVVWYTYDSEGNQRWMIGVGRYADGRAVFEVLHTTRGPRFGEAFDPSDVELIEWGSLWMELDCLKGSAGYESLLPEFGAGTFELDRLTWPAQLACPWETPKLTDLYDIVWTEILIGEDDRISALSIAENGVIAGIRRSPPAIGEPESINLELWRPELEAWQSIPGEIGGGVRISEDGTRVLSSQRVGLHQTIPVLWHQDGGWQPLPGLIYDRSYSYGISKDFSHIVGQGFNQSDNVSRPWIWDSENGQRQLPITDEIVGAPMAVSNDGTTVVGDLFGAFFQMGHPGGGITWTDGNDPELLHNDQGEVLGAAQYCNHDCSVVTGYGLSDNLNSGQYAWFRTNKGQFGFLGTIAEAIQRLDAYVPTGISSDGTVIIGRYSLSAEDSSLFRRPFIWTQNTGIISVPALIADSGVGDNDWDRMTAVSLTSDGSRILLTGTFASDEPGEPERLRAVVLELSAR